MLNYEKENYADTKLIVGLDEAGRGCCAGPLVVGCVIMPQNFNHPLIKDSKQLSQKQREEALEIILENAIETVTTIINAQEVDQLNPKQASRIGMQRCINKLNTKPELVITDFEKINDINIPQINLVKGDQLSINVAAASILAKVTRDLIMVGIDKKFPMYNFKKNKGYCTKEHEAAMSQYGICEFHRKSYKNVKKYLN